MSARSVLSSIGLRRGFSRLGLTALLLPSLLLLQGCIGSRIVHPILPTLEEVAAFDAAGPDMTPADPSLLNALGVGGKDYQVVAGDLLEVELPADIVDIESEELTTKIKARVQQDGSLRLPVAGSVSVVGLTTAEIESLVAGSIVERAQRAEEPSVVVTVASYRTVTVAVFGAVSNAGIHGLRSDRLSLLGALMAAGGIREDGADSIRVVRPTESGPPEVEILPVRGSSIPMTDVALAGGETIVVEPRVEQQFTVIGLVRKPGQQTYPLSRQYNLMQALAVAGGTDSTAAPRYVTIYRKDKGDTVITCTFKIDGTDFVGSANILVKPGDVVAVEHTQGTWTRTFFSSIFGFRLSASASSSGQL